MTNLDSIMNRQQASLDQNRRPRARFVQPIQRRHTCHRSNLDSCAHKPLPKISGRAPLKGRFKGNSKPHLLQLTDMQLFLALEVAALKVIDPEIVIIHSMAQQMPYGI